MTLANHPTASRKILLGITGGIAAYKAAELVRLLTKQHFDVQVVMTEAACKFITPMTMQALSGKPVFVEMWNHTSDNGMAHIDLSRHVDVILIAPASADFIAKLVHGNADDLLSTLCLARNCPLMIAPAMNKQMWENLSTQRNIKQLLQDGIEILGPNSGEQACGEVGLGRMLEPPQLLSSVIAHFTPKILQDIPILITAGATMEMIDPVRGVTNLSSGKMGYALAQAAANMGAKVTLINGYSALQPPENIKFIQATSADAMYQAVMHEILHQAVFISVAAVADYKPIKTSAQKIKKNALSLTIELQKNKDILAEVASLPNPPYCVGFSAETENLVEHASLKRIAKKIPLIIANLVSESMGKEDAQLTLIDETGAIKLPPANKTLLAEEILSFIQQRLKK